METANKPEACIGCGRMTLWKAGRMLAPLCGRRSCGSGSRADEMIVAWEKKQRGRLDVVRMAADAQRKKGQGTA